MVAAVTMGLALGLVADERKAEQMTMDACFGAVAGG